MPNAKGHLYGGVVFHTAFILLFTKNLLMESLLKNFFFGLPFVTIGALIPDADINSYGQKLLLFITICAISVSIAFQTYNLALYATLLLILGHLSKHRGIMHNPIFLLILPALFLGVCKMPLFGAQKFNKFACLSFLNGAFSHIVLDVIQTKTKRFFTRLKGRKSKKS